MVVGYTAGVFDLFHIGHLNLLKMAREKCDRLIVAVSTDELAGYKKKIPVIAFEERAEIVKAIRYVDEVVAQHDLDKIKAWQQYKFDVLFVGDDWKGNEAWIGYENHLNSVGSRVVYLPYTQKTSSTLLKKTLEVIQGVNV